jgi:hypothetical protein
MKSTVRYDYSGMTFPGDPDGTSDRTANQWRENRSGRVTMSGQAVARKWAEVNGRATIRWVDGHATVFKMQNGELHRLRFYPGDQL